MRRRAELIRKLIRINSRGDHPVLRVRSLGELDGTVSLTSVNKRQARVGRRPPQDTKQKQIKKY